jgi:bifunctional DNA-binding transcriptional regulator/antitoxin component of YhaV-PrlF toxin-antitoxin module
MVLPAKARKQARIDSGDVVEVVPEGDGRILLLRMQPVRPPRPAKVRFIKRKGRHMVGTTDRPITSAQVRELLQDFP